MNFKLEDDLNQNIKPNTLGGIDITKMDNKLKIILAFVSIGIIGIIFVYFLSNLGKKNTINKKPKKQN